MEEKIYKAGKSTILVMKMINYICIMTSIQKNYTSSFEHSGRVAYFGPLMN